MSESSLYPRSLIINEFGDLKRQCWFCLSVNYTVSRSTSNLPLRYSLRIWSDCVIIKLSVNFSLSLFEISSSFHIVSIIAWLPASSNWKNLGGRIISLTRYHKCMQDIKWKLSFNLQDLKNHYGLPFWSSSCISSNKLNK